MWCTPQENLALDKYIECYLNWQIYQLEFVQSKMWLKIDIRNTNGVKIVQVIICLMRMILVDGFNLRYFLCLFDFSFSNYAIGLIFITILILNCVLQICNMKTLFFVNLQIQSYNVSLVLFLLQWNIQGHIEK